MIDDKLHIPIQKDIGEYEQKLFGDMSIRTCVCLAEGFATAVLVALASWLWLAIDPSDMTFPIMLATLPFWLAGFWKPHGMPFEKFLPLVARHHMAKRHYEFTPSHRCGTDMPLALEPKKLTRKERREPTERGRSSMSLLKKRRKGVEGAPEKKKEKQKRQKGTIDLCGYELMLENGVAQVAPGLFSQMVQFGDITYQCARKDTRENIYSTMSALYNYFNPDTSVQVTITNEPVPAEEIGNRTFFPKSDPCLDDYVEEYNRILNDKMREGVSNLKRQRYLTFTTKADDIDSAIPKLARMRNDCTQALARIKSKSEPVKGAERLRIARGLLSPLSPFDFDWDNLSQCPTARSLDFVAPMSVDFKPNGRNDAFRADDAWCCVMAIRSFGSILMDDCLASIVDLPIPLSVSLHLQAHPAGQGHRHGAGKDRLDGHGGARPEEPSRQQGNHPHADLHGPSLLARGRRGASGLPAQQERATLRVRRLCVHLRGERGGARRANRQNHLHGQGLCAHRREALLPPGGGLGLRAPLRHQQVRRDQAPHQRPDRHADALRIAGDQPARRHLPRTVEDHQHAGHPGQAIPALAHGIRLRNAGHGQVERPEERLAAGPHALRRQGSGNLDRPYR